MMWGVREDSGMWGKAKVWDAGNVRVELVNEGLREDEGKSRVERSNY